jgi:hypothetical protein
MNQLALSFDEKRRLGKQLERVRHFMCSHAGTFFTLKEISEATGASEPSASARFRDLSNVLGLKTEKRPIAGHRWEYRVASHV